MQWHTSIGIIQEKKRVSMQQSVTLIIIIKKLLISSIIHNYEFNPSIAKEDIIKCMCIRNCVTLGIKQNISFLSSSKMRCLNKFLLSITSERVLLGNVNASLPLPYFVQYLSTCSLCHCDIVCACTDWCERFEDNSQHLEPNI